MTSRLYSWLGLLIAAALLIGANILSYSLLRNMRIDLTENNVYTLTEGTENILKEIEEPIILRFYYSRKLASTTVPGLSAYVTTVQELLEEYRDSSNGKIKLEVIDPEPFSDEEEDASLAGVQSIPIGATGEPMFLGLVGVNSVDETAVIPFFDPNKESFLEYDITSLIYELTNPKKEKIGVLSTLPVLGDNDPFAAMRGGEAKQPFAFITQLRQFFDVEEVSTTAEAIPDDIDVLLVIHPKSLTDATQYAIDQFVLGGGRAMVFVDPLSEAEEVPFDAQNPYQGLWADKSSNLPKLLKAWGVEMEQGVFAADRKLAERVTIRDQRGVSEAVPYVAYITATEEQLNSSDVITSGLGLVRVGSAGSLKQVEDATTTFTPLVQTSNESMTIDTEKIKIAPRPDELLNDFKPLDKPLTIAARISGKVKSAFPGGLKADEESDESEEGEDDTAEEEPAGPHIEESEADIQVIVFADTDILADRFWVDIQNFLGRRILFENASNGSLIVNAVENLGGSNDLISVRSRGTVTRPFELVQELKRKAEDKYRERQVELQERIEEIQQEINDIQANRSDKAAATGVILTAEQRDAIERAREEYQNTRKELRTVQYQLGREVDRLGVMVKAINIAAIPLLISLYAGILGIARLMRRRP
ncbi:MAG: gliding motility-associatede transport system auxiliary component [Candidatus Sumerlaeota bacterium]|nr:gliding motility-associatede transport system auxiliary component [Candidatus Sumerlaeota bacterium]